MFQKPVLFIIVQFFFALILNVGTIVMNDINFRIGQLTLFFCKNIEISCNINPLINSYLEVY